MLNGTIHGLQSLARNARGPLEGAYARVLINMQQTQVL